VPFSYLAAYDNFSGLTFGTLTLPSPLAKGEGFKTDFVDRVHIFSIKSHISVMLHPLSPYGRRFVI